MKRLLLSLVMLAAVAVTAGAQTQLKAVKGTTSCEAVEQLKTLSTRKAAVAKVRRTLKTAATAAADGSAADEGSLLVLTPPAGEERYYYLDQDAFDPYSFFTDYPFLMDYHTKVKFVFCDNGDVWMPCILNRNNMKGYVKGRYNADRTQLVFENGQPVYWAPNEKVYYLLALGDETGGGAPAASTDGGGTSTQGSISAVPTLYDADICFDVDADGVISFDDSRNDKLPFLSVVNASDPAEKVYAISSGARFVPAATVDDNLQDFAYAYHNERAGEDKSASVKLWKDGNGYYFKGLNPKYPEMWVYGQESSDGESVIVPSLQVSKYDMYDFPYYFLAISKKDGAGDADDTSAYDVLLGFTMALDKATGAVSALPESDGVLMANGYANEEVTAMDFFQRYNQLSLSPVTLSLAKPAAPVFYGYRDAYGENEFVFTVSDKDVDGNVLSTDNLAYVIYVDGQPYTFRKSEYSYIKTDEMTAVPYLYDDYYTVSASSSGNRYVYLKGQDNATTIGVEMQYTVGGQTAVSDRLVYNRQTKQSEVVTAGIAQVGAQRKAVATALYDLTGRRVTAAYKGVAISVSRMADGTVTSRKVVR